MPHSRIGSGHCPAVQQLEVQIWGSERRTRAVGEIGGNCNLRLEI